MYKSLLLGLVFASGTAAAVADSYSGTATSGTAANTQASFLVTAGATTTMYYVDVAASNASDKKAPPLQLVKPSHWTFDFSNPAAVAFTGTIVYGDYKTQTNVTGFVTIDGRQSYSGVTQSFSGTGSFDPATNTFTFNSLNDKSNGGGASTVMQGSAACENGSTSFLGKVCGASPLAISAWEGLSLSLVFAADKSSFSGALQGIDISGSGASASTVKTNWQISAKKQ